MERRKVREKRKMMSKGDLKNRSAQELRKARQSVKDGLEHWHQLFRGDKGKAYRQVGEVKRERGMKRERETEGKRKRKEKRNFRSL